MNRIQLIVQKLFKQTHIKSVLGVIMAVLFITGVFTYKSLRADSYLSDQFNFGTVTADGILMEDTDVIDFGEMTLNGSKAASVNVNTLINIVAANPVTFNVRLIGENGEMYLFDLLNFSSFNTDNIRIYDYEGTLEESRSATIEVSSGVNLSSNIQVLFRPTQSGRFENAILELVDSNGATDQIQLFGTGLEIVEFNDFTLEQIVRDAIGKANGPIYNTDLESLTFLSSLEYANLPEMTDLTGLEYATNLEELYLPYNNIIDLTALSNLTNLKILSLANNEVSNLSSLSGLQNLSKLYVGSNKVENVDGLLNLNSLSVFDLSYNSLSNIDALYRFENLHELYLISNGLINVDSIGDLINLEILNLDNNAIDNLSSLSNLVNLKQLYLINNKLSDISPLQNLLSLEILKLSRNGLTNINTVSNLINLKELYLDYNDIYLIDNFSNLSLLETLNLSNNHLSNLTALLNFSTNIKNLNLSSNEIENISAISSLSSLEILDLSNNVIKNINEFISFTNLRDFYLANNQISDISSIGNFLNLEILDVSYNYNIQDISALSNLEKLQDIYLQFNSINDLQALVDNLNIAENDILDISSNPLRDTAACSDIVTLEARGVNVIYDLYVCEDADFDGEAAYIDNCVNDINEDQANFDNDEQGDICDIDIDGDSVPNSIDHCSTTRPLQEGEAVDGIGCLAEEKDTDSDGVTDNIDNCLEIENSLQIDTDLDGLGDICDMDLDGDSVPNSIDHCQDPTFGSDEVNGVGCPLVANDNDGDGISDDIDNCLAYMNPGQEDYDGDGIGDGCDIDGFPDVDSDGINDATDNCQIIYNPDQLDFDNDGQGDACETGTLEGDFDGDGILDNLDNCVDLANTDQIDTDSDGEGDACDLDLDGDGLINIYEVGYVCLDQYVVDSNLDPDNDGVVSLAEYNSGTDPCTYNGGGTVDNDSDDDGVLNNNDNCPSIANFDQLDSDNDGIGDACDEGGTIDNDSDDDGVLDTEDNCVLIANSDQLDSDNDGIGDACENDVDGDGITDVIDNCPLVINPDQNDTDLDGIGDACENDYDGDGILDAEDNCPDVQNHDQLDSDNDGIGDVCDGGGTVDNDSDDDGVLNENDNCPSVANLNQLNLDGDSFGDACDDDLDGDILPNYYEEANNCLDPYVIDSDLDPDNDGVISLDEFIRDTDPCNKDGEVGGHAVFTFYSNASQITELYFGSVLINSFAEKVIEIKNTGDISATPELNINNSVFTISSANNSCLGRELGVNSVCSLTLVFTPTTAISYQGILTASSLATLDSAILNLSGSGTSSVSNPRHTGGSGADYDLLDKLLHPEKYAEETDEDIIEDIIKDTTKDDQEEGDTAQKVRRTLYNSGRLRYEPRDNFRFIDIAEHWGEDYINLLKSYKNRLNQYAISGETKEGGNSVGYAEFQPDNYATRLAVMKVTLIMNGYDITNQVRRTGPLFMDIVASTSLDSPDLAWIRSVVYSAYRADIIDGNSELSRYSDFVTRDELVAMSARGAHLFDGGEYIVDKFKDVTGWSKDLIGFMEELIPLNGRAKGLFAPNSYATKAEMAKILIEVAKVNPFIMKAPELAEPLEAI